MKRFRVERRYVFGDDLGCVVGRWELLSIELTLGQAREAMWHYRGPDVEFRVLEVGS